MNRFIFFDAVTLLVGVYGGFIGLSLLMADRQLKCLQERLLLCSSLSFI